MAKRVYGEELEQLSFADWPRWLTDARFSDLVEWHALASLTELPHDHVLLSYHLFHVQRRCESDMPVILHTFERRRGAPLTEKERETAAHASHIANALAEIRIRRRDHLCTPIPLPMANFDNEPYSLCIQLYHMECFCRAIAYFSGSTAPDTRTSNDFAVLSRYPMVKTLPNMAVMEYPVSRLRLAIYRIAQHWDIIPILDDEFIDYLICLRVRASVLQVMGYDDRSELDYSAWTKEVGVNRKSKRMVYRASMVMAQMLETLFYHLDRFILHDRQFRSVAQAVPESLCSELDVAYFKNWISERGGDTWVFLDEWRRQVNMQCMADSLYPHEFDTVKIENPGTHMDIQTMLRFFKAQKLDDISRLFVVSSSEQLLELQPLVARFYQLLFLLQSRMNSFNLNAYLRWPSDVSRTIIGTDYPDLAYFFEIGEPLIYIPHGRAHIWLISHDTLYDCGNDYYKAMAAWLRIAMGLMPAEMATRAYEQRLTAHFEALRTAISARDYIPPVIFKRQLAPNEESPSEAPLEQDGILGALSRALASDSDDDSESSQLGPMEV